MLKSVITGVGGYLPEKILTNQDLEKMVETTDAWIMERTGIKTRHLAKEGELTSDLAIKAAQRAMEDAGVSPEEIDLIVLSTTTPDETFPATAMKVQEALGAHKAFAFDIQAACSGFMYALSTADHFLRGGTGTKALVIGAETLSRIVDWTDRNTCVLFGDGAGAVVLETREGAGTLDEAGLKKVILHSDGRYRSILTATGGVSSTGNAGKIYMEGREVFRHAVTNLADVAVEVLTQAGVQTKDINVLVPHQANLRIIEGTAKKLGLSMDHVIVTLPEQGNTSSASIPLALYHGVKTGRIQKGDLLLLESMGAGFTWAGALVRF